MEGEDWEYWTPPGPMRGEERLRMGFGGRWLEGLVGSGELGAEKEWK